MAVRLDGRPAKRFAYGWWHRPAPLGHQLSYAWTTLCHRALPEGDGPTLHHPKVPPDKWEYVGDRMLVSTCCNSGWARLFSTLTPHCMKCGAVLTMPEWAGTSRERYYDARRLGQTHAEASRHFRGDDTAAQIAQHGFDSIHN